jgi:hypothetical protein
MLQGVKRLAKHYSIDATALDGWLTAVRDEYKRNTEYSANISRKKEVRNSLGPIARQAKKLQDSLNNLPLPIQQSLNYWPVGEDSLLGNLSIELPFLADRATEVAQGWKKKKYRDNSTDIAILRIARAWRRLTGMPATCKNASDEPNDLAPKYFNGNWYGEFLDFFTIACDIVGVKDKKGLPISADVAVKQFIELKQRNLMRKASTTRER